MMIYINNYILELSENHHTILYNSYITILLYNYFITMISLWNSSATESSTIGGHFYDSTALTTDPWLTITHLGERCFTESITVPNRAIKNTKSDWFLYGIILYTYFLGGLRWPIVGKLTDQPVSWDGIGKHLMAFWVVPAGLLMFGMSYLGYLLTNQYFMGSWDGARGVLDD